MAGLQDTTQVQYMVEFNSKPATHAVFKKFRSEGSFWIDDRGKHNFRVYWPIAGSQVQYLVEYI
jgi:hypothetical protein